MCCLWVLAMLLKLCFKYKVRYWKGKRIHLWESLSSKIKRGVLQFSTGDRQKEEKGACSLRRRLNKIQRLACRKKSDWLHTKTSTVDINPGTSLNILPLTHYKIFLMKHCSIFSETVTESPLNSTPCVHSTFTAEQSTVKCYKCKELHKAA